MKKYESVFLKNEKEYDTLLKNETVRGRKSMNIYDIAKEAGVSITTVSRVMNHREQVNAETRERVEKVLKAHHYKPNAVARNLVKKSSRTVAVLTIDIRKLHYARTAYTIERELSRRGYEAIICNTGGEQKEAQRYLESLMKKDVDGIILVGSIFNEIGKDPEIKAMLKTFPVVLANGQLDLKESYSVLVDDQWGIGLAVDHLVEKGHRDIFYFMDQDTGSAREKRTGFINSMKKHGFEDTEEKVVHVPASPEGGQLGVRQLLEQNRKVSAIVCGNDDIAAGVVKELTMQGVKIPEQVAVTGYNHSEYARICQPELTTIDNKPELVAMLCVQLIISLIEKTDNYSSCVIRPELVPGKSS